MGTTLGWHRAMKTGYMSKMKPKERTKILFCNISLAWGIQVRLSGRWNTFNINLFFFRAFCSRNSANFDSFVLSFKYNQDISVQITLQCNAPKNVLKTCFPSYRNQSIDLISKSIDWFLYNGIKGFITCKTSQSNLKKTRTQYFLSKRNYMWQSCID